MEYDDIIVGAGSSGAVLAARLSEDADRAVLLLEAGPDYTSVEQTPRDLLNSRALSLVEHDWMLAAEAVPGRMIPYPRGKVTGGCSAVNGVIALRGLPADYDEWAELGNEGWGWEQVLLYFRRLEDDRDALAGEDGGLHGRGGPIPIRRWKRDELAPLSRAFLDVCKQQGFAEVTDHNDPDQTGVGPQPTNGADGIRVSTAIGYLLPARHRLNLTVRPHCLVNRVLFEGRRAVGVEIESGGVTQRVLGKRITLSAGAIASPAILLRSGIGPPADLEPFGIATLVNLPGVGADLIDHPLTQVMFAPKPGVYDPDIAFTQVFVRYTATGSNELNDMQLYITNGLDFTAVPELVAITGSPIVFTFTVSLQRPHSRGRLTLASADPTVQPTLVLNFLDNPEDMRRMVEGVRLAWQIGRSPSIREFAERAVILTDGMVASDEAVEGYLRETVGTIFHPVGTARMGPDGDHNAVVDQQCRVRGVEGLRVVDASVMPGIPRANTNLTCIMIGERVADWMRAAD
jgi:choline dehydrogenase